MRARRGVSLVSLQLDVKEKETYRPIVVIYTLNLWYKNHKRDNFVIRRGWEVLRRPERSEIYKFVRIRSWIALVYLSKALRSLVSFAAVFWDVTQRSELRVYMLGMVSDSCLATKPQLSPNDVV